MNTYLDHYCERIDSVTWGEPFNIISNIAFLIAAYFLYRKTKNSQPPFNISIADIWILTGLIFFIGIGSATWHTLAQHWALWADRTPILAFISLFILSSLVRVLKFSLAKAFVIFFGFHVINSFVLTVFPASTLNGSLFYIPTGALLFGITIILWYRENIAVKKYFLIGSIIFTVAIVFRTMDLSACAVIPIGTHFAWHLLIALTIFVLMSGLIATINNSVDKNIENEL